MYNDVVSQNVIYSTAQTARTVWVTYGGTALISNNLYYSSNGQSMNGTCGDNLRDSSGQYGNPNFANPGGGEFSLGSGTAAGAIGFSAIDQGSMALMLATAHWYEFAIGMRAHCGSIPRLSQAAGGGAFSVFYTSSVTSPGSMD